MPAPDSQDKRATMNVSLTPELKRFVDDKVHGGLYTSASEVIREGLRLLAEEDKLRELRRKEFGDKVRAGLDELQRGEGLDGEAAFDQLEADLDQHEKRHGKT